MSAYDVAFEMKFAEAIGAPLFNENGWVNLVLIHSDPLSENWWLYEVFYAFYREAETRATAEEGCLGWNIRKMCHGY